MVAERIMDDLKALKATGIWREFAVPRARPFSPELRGHEEAKAPAICATLRVKHALVTAAHLLLALSKRSTDDE